jgi:hypothetical protein
MTVTDVRVPCPCCRYFTLNARSDFEVCPVCLWEDDGQDEPDRDEVRGGPNGDLSLTAARENFRRIGACDQAALPHVRPPLASERSDEAV